MDTVTYSAAMNGSMQCVRAAQGVVTQDRNYFSDASKTGL